MQLRCFFISHTSTTYVDAGLLHFYFFYFNRKAEMLQTAVINTNMKQHSEINKNICTGLWQDFECGHTDRSSLFHFKNYLVICIRGSIR